MSAINDILNNVPIPKMVKVQQNFESSVLENVDTELKNQLANKNFNRKFTTGMSIAVTAGSRGVANMALTIRTVCDFLKEIGCKPFIIPAMGSHGGSTAEGQRMILSSFGITEETMGGYPLFLPWKLSAFRNLKMVLRYMLIKMPMKQMVLLSLTA